VADDGLNVYSAGIKKSNIMNNEWGRAVAVSPLETQLFLELSRLYSYCPQAILTHFFRIYAHERLS
jgi:hypothetical protein